MYKPICYIYINFPCRENALKEGQECCYDDDGNLTIGQSNGGSVNKFAPKDYKSGVDHMREDILPYVYLLLQSRNVLPM